MTSPLSRWGLRSRRRPRGGSWRWSWPGASAVGIDAPAGAGADRGRGVHRALPPQPLSSMRAPTPARMLLFVLISVSFSAVASAVRAIQGPRPARTAVVVAIRASAVGVDAGPVGGAERGGGVHRRLTRFRWGRWSRRGRREGPVSVLIFFVSRGGWCQPSGSISGPAPPRTVVVVVIRASAVGVDAEPASGADGGHGVHGTSAAVGVDAGAVPRADRGLGVHLRLPCVRGGSQPPGSIPGPGPACIAPWPGIGASAVVVDARAHSRADGGLVGHRSSPGGVDFQPLGSTMDPCPARMVVLACMAAPCVSRCRPSAGRRLRGCGSGWPSGSLSM
jgi:hypothetical protein